MPGTKQGLRRLRRGAEEALTLASGTRLGPWVVHSSMFEVVYSSMFVDGVSIGSGSGRSIRSNHGSVRPQGSARCRAMECNRGTEQPVQVRLRQQGGRSRRGSAVRTSAAVRSGACQLPGGARVHAGAARDALRGRSRSPECQGSARLRGHLRDLPPVPAVRRRPLVHAPWSSGRRAPGGGAAAHVAVSGPRAEAGGHLARATQPKNRYVTPIAARTPMHSVASAQASAWRVWRIPTEPKYTAST